MPDYYQTSYPTVDVSQMHAFVQEHAASSPHLPEYLKAVNDILHSKDEATIRNAYQALQRFMEETGKIVWLGGLTDIANKVASKFGKHV